LKEDAIINRDGVTLVERVDAPTSEHVAMIWCQEEGEAPIVKGNVTYSLKFGM
jgi:hypothetical protein